MLSIASTSSIEAPKGNGRALTAWIILFAIVVTDQMVKYFIKTHFVLHESVSITPWFEILFTENRGLAFGMEFIGTTFLALFRVAAIVVFSMALVRFVHQKVPYGLIVCGALIIAGAIGNIIDNLFYGLIYTESLPFGEPARLVPFGEGYGSFLSGRVVDMLYFPLFTWPDWMPWCGGDIFFGAIFNVADAAISCGAVALIIFYFKYLTREQFFGKVKVDGKSEEAQSDKMATETKIQDQKTTERNV